MKTTEKMKSMVNSTTRKIVLIFILLVLWMMDVKTQSLYIDTDGDEGPLGGTNWSISGGKLTVTEDDATIKASVVENYLQNYGNLVMEVPGNIVIRQSILPSLNVSRTLTFKSNGYIYNYNTIGSNSMNYPLNMVFWSDADGNDNGRIVLYQESQIISNNGNVWMGGGSGSTTWKSITVGNSYAASGTGIYGINCQGATINAGTGDLYMNGKSVNTSGNSRYGVRISDSGGILSSVYACNIEIIGTGSPSTGSYYSHDGVQIKSNSTVVASGSVNITGYAGGSNSSGDGNWGVTISNCALTLNGSGNLTISGTGGQGSGTDNFGVAIGGTSVITLGTGNCSITGINGSNSTCGILFSSTAVLKSGMDGSGTSNIDLIADDWNIDSTTVLVKSTGIHTIRPYNSASTIGIGNGSTGTMVLHSEFFTNNLASTFSKIVIGSATSGNIHFYEAPFQTPVTFEGASGSTLNVTSNVDITGKAITLGQNISLNETTGALYGTSGTLTATRILSNPSTLNVAGLGFVITSSSNLGETVITRGQSAQSTLFDNSSGIKRYFDIVPTNNSNLNASIVFRYSSQDLLSLALREYAFDIYKSTVGNTSFVSQSGTLDAIANTVSLSNVSSFSRFTIGEDCYNPTSGGTIASNQTICYNATPAEITSSTLPTGQLGDLDFKWQQSTTSATAGFSDIIGATDTSYLPEALTDTTWYRRLTRVDCMADWTGCDTSNVVKITVRKDFTPGAIQSTGETICSGGDPAEIGSLTNSSGGDETVTYSWYKSTNDFTDSTFIAGANSASYNPVSGMTETTSYRRYAKDGTCNTVFETSTGTWEVIIQSQPVANAGADASIVEGETYTISDASAENYTSVSWITTLGDGTFDNESLVKPTYTPGIADIIAGGVGLNMMASPVSPCISGDADTLNLTIWRYPVLSLSAPAQGDLFYSNPVTFSGTASDQDNDLSLIEVKLNNNSWQTATGTTSWTISLNLAPGKNIIMARAKDLQNLYSDTANVSVTLSIQVINIPQGWSYISSYLRPSDSNIVNMWSDIVGANHLGILTGVQGIYAPPPLCINTLGNWDVLKGYKVKMSVQDELIVSGDSLVDKTVPFSAGVHLIPVLTNQTTPLDEVILSPATDVLYMLDIYSNLVYWPGGGINTLTELVPGKGYLANFKNPLTLTYPPMSNFILDDATSLPPAPGPWACNRTSNVHLISVSFEAIKDLQNAGYIGAFDSQGNCVGYAQIEKLGQNILLTVYGDEPITTENDGLMEGEMLRFRIFDINKYSEKELTATFNPTYPNMNGLFAINGLSGISWFKESPTGVGVNDLAASVQVYPNPAKDVVSITLTGFNPETSGLSGLKKGLTATLLTAEGKLAKTFSITSPTTQLDVSDLQPGIYLLKITSENQVVVKRVVKQ